MTDFSVITLDNASFADACRRLRSLSNAAGFQPDAVIAIPRGGYRLLEHGWPDIPKIDIEIRKSRKFSLKKYASFFLRMLPLSWRDRIRVWDARRLVRRSSHISSSSIVIPAISPSVSKVLLVDDAVDSGATLLAVTQAIRDARPDLEVRSAAITVTDDTPVAMPDFYLYHNSTLVRMPWSIDA